MDICGRWIGIVAAAVGMLTASTLADAAPGHPAGRFMVTGSFTSQPIGHYDFCKRFRSECTVHPDDARGARLTNGLLNYVRQVNSAVNGSIMPETDEVLYGKEEYWTYPTTAGDCEDYALLKQYMLEQHGISPSDLLIAVVRKPNGEGHAVLTLRTDRGDYVLDNLDEAVKLWNHTPYTYLKRQDTANSGRWVSIDNGSEMLVGSVR